MGPLSTEEGNEDGLAQRSRHMDGRGWKGTLHKSGKAAVSRISDLLVVVLALTYAVCSVLGGSGPFIPYSTRPLSFAITSMC